VATHLPADLNILKLINTPLVMWQWYWYCNTQWECSTLGRNIPNI